jgi:hypothetical protein
VAVEKTETLITPEIGPKGRSSLRTPDGRSKAKYVKDHMGELRERAAAIAVDMEEGMLHNAEGEPTVKWEGPVDKRAIVRRLGFSGKWDLPAFMAEPAFTRAMEFERIRRVASSTNRMGKDEVATLASMIGRAGMLEVARRFVMDPESINNRELLPESRAFARMAAEIEGAQSGGSGNVHQTINVFFEAAGRLPPKAREKFLGIFDASMKKMALAAGEARQRADVRGVSE